MASGPKVISMIKVNDELGEHWYYAGTDNNYDAEQIALTQGHKAEAVTIKQIPNKFGIQHGEWRQAAP